MPFWYLSERVKRPRGKIFRCCWATAPVIQKKHGWAGLGLKRQSPGAERMVRSLILRGKTDSQIEVCHLCLTFSGPRTQMNKKCRLLWFCEHNSNVQKMFELPETRPLGSLWKVTPKQKVLKTSCLVHCFENNYSVKWKACSETSCVTGVMNF